MNIDADWIGYVEIIPKHPESIATTQNQAGSMKKRVIIEVGNPDD